MDVRPQPTSVGADWNGHNAYPELYQQQQPPLPPQASLAATSPIAAKSVEPPPDAPLAEDYTYRHDAIAFLLKCANVLQLGMWTTCTALILFHRVRRSIPILDDVFADDKLAALTCLWITIRTDEIPDVMRRDVVNVGWRLMKGDGATILAPKSEDFVNLNAELEAGYCAIGRAFQFDFRLDDHPMSFIVQKTNLLLIYAANGGPILKEIQDYHYNILRWSFSLCADACINPKIITTFGSDVIALSCVYLALRYVVGGELPPFEKFCCFDPSPTSEMIDAGKDKVPLVLDCMEHLVALIAPL
ncbi:hypothetical protein SeMB42_g05565 [Synchytrium endobioticum]|uniref:Uncharacterized protein n=1 Tax=Synchytrium endobioticum TaxID=286115 RepID=A0A507CQP2_9FUNG|nr:hypothetical protein SeLEV6574_g06239 [Synchytrium endobioticum]TPX41472.1 hypothetical protein SeMB42_g05565 [Synchytrium endobioticum]